MATVPSDGRPSLTSPKYLKDNRWDSKAGNFAQAWLVIENPGKTIISYTKLLIR